MTEDKSPAEQQKELQDQFYAVKTLIEGIGDTCSRDGTQETPGRVVRAMKEMYCGYEEPGFKMTTFPSDYTGIVYRVGIPFTAYCEHHMAPFSGTIDFAYIPDGTVIGISKIIRLFRHYTSRLWTQEDMTIFLIDKFEEVVHSKGCAIIIEATHTCEGNRGVKVPGVTTGTAAVRGVFETEADLEQKFYRLIGR